MPPSLHIANRTVKPEVCTARNDTRAASFYLANMARTRPVIDVGWYLPEWMDAFEVDQTYMIEHAGWSKTTASLLYNRQQDYNPNLVKAASKALGVAPWELLMHPDEAFHIRRLRAVFDEENRRRAAEPRQPWIGPAPADPSGRLLPLKPRKGRKPRTPRNPA